MPVQNFTAKLIVDNSPEEVFNAVCNVDAWWATGFTGASHRIGDEFETRFGDVHYSRMRVAELVPGSRISWLVTDSHLTFLSDKSEWTGTQVHFDIFRENGKTLLRFTHEGLVPAIECYKACSPAWGKYLQYSLLPLITTGKGQPGFPPSDPPAM